MQFCFLTLCIVNVQKCFKPFILFVVHLRLYGTVNVVFFLCSFVMINCCKTSQHRTIHIENSVAIFIFILKHYLQLCLWNFVLENNCSNFKQISVLNSQIILPYCLSLLKVLELQQSLGCQIEGQVIHGSIMLDNEP